ncbi:hypothetical protein [Ponticaulis sp.]|uniref:hypothetical protein n=1 Tax=Ponticaulis sp. TaxID=2020902 RepID=UPI000C4F0567|nr:hypothetical protein [Ponticaulis sp.]MAF57621.1 hypothetical protein [Ponticaulis sp.]MBN02671.1 hypothetical protein [Ponticaulis sp.]|tara:strand:- start:107 stop:469 length:363 start_codon:yes stop_codon:yes gene_type:complete
MRRNLSFAMLGLVLCATPTACGPRLMTYDDRAERGKLLLAEAVSQSDVITFHIAEDAATAEVVANIEMRDDEFCFDSIASRSNGAGNWVNHDQNGAVRQRCLSYAMIYYLTPQDLRDTQE